LEYIRFEALGKAIRMRPIVGMGYWWTRQTMSP
jgi:hypothetical protein